MHQVNQGHFRRKNKIFFTHFKLKIFEISECLYMVAHQNSSRGPFDYFISIIILCRALPDWLFLMHADDFSNKKWLWPQFIEFLSRYPEINTV